MKRIITLACLLAASACTMRQEQHALRLMTWNIAAGFGDLAATAAVIGAADADVVALQEVDVHWSARSGFVDQATILADALGMDVRFGPIYRIPSDTMANMREFGLAILTRLPVVSFDNHIIPRLSTQSNATEPEPMPGFLEMVVQVGGSRVHVFNTHLDYREDPRVRVLQVDAMLALLDRATGPVVLAGDLNAAPSAPELAPLLARLLDAWRDRADDRDGLTYPADAPVRRIDYILHSRDIRTVDVRVPDVRASDHRPVVADIRVLR